MATKIINRIPGWVFALLVSISLLIYASGCASSKPIQPPELNQPISDVSQSLSTIDVRADYIKNLANRIVGEANDTLKQLSVQNAEGIKGDVSRARGQIEDLLEVNGQLTGRFDDQNSRIRELEVNYEKVKRENAEINNRFWSPKQVKLFWGTIVAYVIFQVVTGIVLGQFRGPFIQSVGKFFVRALPVMNITSHIRDYLARRKAARAV